MDSYHNDILLVEQIRLSATSERAYTLGKYRGKQVAQEPYQKVLYYRQVKKLSIRETPDAADYSASQVCRRPALHKILNLPEKL